MAGRLVARCFNADPADKAANDKTAAVVFMMELLFDDQERLGRILSNE